MNQTTQSRTLALAGLFQSVQLVQQTARGGTRDQAATRSCIGSLFATDAASVLAVFGTLPDLRCGLEVLIGQLDNDQGRRDLELTAYVITLLHHERRLSRNRTMMGRLATGIEQVHKQAEYFGAYNATVIAALADLYQQTISTLSPRIMVRGEPGLLATPENQQLIRALLLAGIRSAVLWRQCGGSRWRLVLQRKPLLNCAQQLMSEARWSAS
jgi:high frequency lysogenization protein